MINFNKSIKKSIDIHLFDCKLEKSSQIKILTGNTNKRWNFKLSNQISSSYISNDRANRDMEESAHQIQPDISDHLY